MNVDQIYNTKFSAADAERQLQRTLNAWWNNNSHLGLALSRSDLYEIMAAKEKSITMVNAMFDRLMEEANTRRENFEKFEDWKFISLGKDCFSRSLTTRWGFKKWAALGEKSRPFDLAIHRPSAVKTLIESDFEGYLDSKNLAYLEKANYCINRKLGIAFNHETGPEYAENDFAKLRAAILPRVELFKKDLQDTAKTCFVLRLESPTQEEWNGAKDLIETIFERSQSEEPIILCLFILKHGEKLDPSLRDGYERNGVYIIDDSYPVENYIWHRHKNSWAGKSFEERVVHKVALTLEQHEASVKSENKTDEENETSLQ